MNQTSKIFIFITKPFYRNITGYMTDGYMLLIFFDEAQWCFKEQATSTFIILYFQLIHFLIKCIFLLDVESPF